MESAISAGADAVYLGGNQYGARAYAENFSKEEIIRGIHLAHVFGRKIYLTVNTLVKEKELDPLYDYLLPFYEGGLDGVIVQDLGVLRFIKTHFPKLSLHASTQMTVTGWRGAEFLSREGVSRVVPARELSIEEIIEMKKRTGMEIETFIHGAMCYCYSGQCLFSSILGGRSGNRGRCAQPCRLPYSVEGHKGSPNYILSMRDMCTLDLLPELIRSGIDSFKIEGRMKKPEYTAGVTAIYRKYIDRYYETLDNNKIKDKKTVYHIDKEDREQLHSLYIRSNIGEGYYHQQNGREMLTLTSPAYSETDEKLLQKIRESLVDRLAIPVNAQITLEAGKEAALTLEGGGNFVTIKGDTVQAAQKQPLSEEKIANQIQKSGQSLLRIEQVQVNKNGDIFIPIGALNQLRREAAAGFEKLMIQKNGLDHVDREPVLLKSCGQLEGSPLTFFVLHALVQTKEQLLAAVCQKIARIYLDYSLLSKDHFESTKEILEHTGNKEIEFYAATPYIVRAANEKCLLDIRQAVDQGLLSGVLIRNLESFAFFENCLSARQMALDANLYFGNRESIHFWNGRIAEYFLPAECNAGEWRRLAAYDGAPFPRQSVQIYGRQPMMVTANCIKKTTSGCEKKSGVLTLKDRYGKLFPVYHDCTSCYNVIYNSVPLSLHELFRDPNQKPMCCRMDFTVEDRKESVQVIAYFQQIISSSRHRAKAEGYAKPVFEYTTGHYKRGVE